MSYLAPWVVHQPLNLLVVGVLFAALYLVLRRTDRGKGRRAKLLLVAAVAWGLYAAWEWLVMTVSPEANIRVDLLVTVPAMLVLSIVCLAMALYSLASTSR